jgi:hypothetical protein
MTKFLSMFALAAFTLTGCGTTVRYLTATSWVAPPGSDDSAEAPAAPAAEGEAAPAAAPKAAGGIKSKYYLTYWEGDCKAVLGCPRGDTHVKRCTVNGDNSVTCVEEANATKAFNPD